MTIVMPLDDAFLVNQTATDGDQSDARVAALAGGGFVICWTDHGDGSSGSCVRGQIYAADGKPLGEELLIGGQGELDRLDPAVAATADGGFVVSWSTVQGDRERVAETADDRAVASRSAEHEPHDEVAAAAEDGSVVRWSAERDVRDEAAGTIESQAFDADGQPVGKDLSVTEHSSATGSAVTGLSDDRFVVSWTEASDDGGDVNAAILSERGERSTMLHLSDRADGTQSSPAAALLDNGGFVAVWASRSDGDRDDDGFSVQGRLFDAKGGALGESFQVNLGTKFDQAAPQVAAVPHGFVVVWADQGVQDEGAIHARFFDEDGAPRGEDVDIALHMHDADVTPTIAVNDAGQLLIACASSGIVYAQQFGADGTALCDVVQLPAQDGSERTDVSAAVLASGGFVLSWTEHDPKSGDGSGTTVQAQLFSAGDEQTGQDDKFGVDEDQPLRVHWKELLENDGLSPTGEVSVAAVDGITHGTVKVDDDGFIVFTPDTDFNGVASFTYHLKGDDGFTATATAHVVVNPVDDAPVAVDDLFTASAGARMTGSVGGNDHDVDSTDLSYTLLTPVAGLSMDEHGAFVFDGSDKAYRHLAAGVAKDVVADYQLTDEAGATGTAKLTLHVVGVNDAPTKLALTPLLLAENSAGGTAAGTVHATDYDGDTLSYSLKDDAGGRFVVDPVTGAITVADGAVLDYEATHSLRIVVDASDGQGGVVERGFTIRLADMAETVFGDDGANRLRAQGSGDWRLEGLGGNDRLSDGSGHVTLVGGTGNDTYVVGNAGTSVVELAGEGTDSVSTSLASYTLGDNVENLRATGVSSFSGTGNDLANIIQGNSGADTIAGLAGDDRLSGGFGEDTLLGGLGRDWLVGGAGADVLTGGADADRFRFLSLSDSNATGGIDRITDFSHAEHDLIDLKQIDGIAGTASSRFHFVGDTPFSGHAGELRYEHADGDTVVMGDVNGDGHADLAITLTGTLWLTSGDFIL